VTNSGSRTGFVCCWQSIAVAISRHAVRFVLPTVLLMLSAGAKAQIQFENATAGSGIVHSGESYGASWGDLNGDGWPDLFSNNHRQTPALLINNGNGTFVDRFLEVDPWATEPLLDQHGAAWGDFNNDGFEDLFVSLGARDKNQFLVNEGGVLVDRTVEFGLDLPAYTSWPGRTPLWLDFNADGWLDFIMMLRGRPKIFEQSGGAFIWVNPTSGVVCLDSQYGHLVDLNVDGRLDLVCDNHTLWPSKIYDTSTFPFTDITSILPPVASVNDTAVADFDGDLRYDIYQVRGITRLSDAVLVGDNHIEAQLNVDTGIEEWFSFQSDGVISIVMDWAGRNVSRLFVGSTGFHPGGFSGADPISFSLDPSDPLVWGILPHDPAVDDGVYIGFDGTTGYWEIRVSAGARPINLTYWFVDTTTTISDLTIHGLGAGEFPFPASLLMNDVAGFVDEASTRGLGAPIKCVSAVAGDFDNDMDQDIYVVCRGGVTNIENRLYENLGDGTFQLVANAGGASGPTGIGVGVGENVVVADYDVDGFLDLYVTNGLNIYPEEPLLTNRGGPDELYHNIGNSNGNSNSWIELDLVGTVSNRSGVGAKVYATANGVTQLREQNGGYHRWAQNHQRIHFGLAPYAMSSVDTL